MTNINKIINIIIKESDPERYFNNINATIDNINGNEYIVRGIFDAIDEPILSINIIAETLCFSQENIKIGID